MRSQSQVYHGVMFRLFKRRAGRHPGLRVADGRMQIESMGRLPEDVAAGGPAQAPVPEYVAEAATPSEDVWAREQERYRAKNQGSE